MRKMLLKVHDNSAAVLEQNGSHYTLKYNDDYKGEPVSLTLPVSRGVYEFSEFPPFLDGLLPEGIQLELLLQKYKLDADDYFSQIILVGEDLVGAVTVMEIL